ncbi:putative protein rhomboid-like [Penaeus vannamei]|uniref:rhomboid protease n=1 Tax=Penaeus vannamei TaxID=6689 RepID=A0A423SF65_PENVA|nr:putative protein rhomboid-like [Penaeus vannamei]
MSTSRLYDRAKQNVNRRRAGPSVAAPRSVGCVTSPSQRVIDHVSASGEDIAGRSGRGEGGGGSGTYAMVSGHPGSHTLDKKPVRRRTCRILSRYSASQQTWPLNKVQAATASLWLDYRVGGGWAGGEGASARARPGWSGEGSSPAVSPFGPSSRHQELHSRLFLALGVFAYYTVITGEMNVAGPVPIDSPFIYRPDKRHHVWRFFFYAFLHAGWVHLAFNLLVQLLVGLPLEMVHGSARIGTVYLAGVLAGSLGTSVFDADVYLVGASGGVYALLAAHLANVLINYNNMQFGILRLIGVFFVASADVGFAIYDRYAHETVGLPVSYVAHLTGALAGLTLGLVVLKNFEQRLHEQLLWWVALGVYAACTMFAILFNFFHPYPYIGVAQGLLL